MTGVTLSTLPIQLDYNCDAGFILLYYANITVVCTHALTHHILLIGILCLFPSSFLRDSAKSLLSNLLCVPHCCRPMAFFSWSASDQSHADERNLGNPSAVPQCPVQSMFCLWPLIDKSGALDVRPERWWEIRWNTKRDMWCSWGQPRLLSQRKTIGRYHLNYLLNWLRSYLQIHSLSFFFIYEEDSNMCMFCIHCILCFFLLLRIIVYLFLFISPWCIRK